MCGILGALPGRDRNHFEAALSTLTPRGPDGSGIWGDSNITLGHRRLSILDVGIGGNQPMISHNGRYVMIYNGELYNFVEIRTELKKLGYKFRSESDTEVFLCAYDYWKERCLTKFNGMWSVAIWDIVDKSLFLSRDRFGKKPLFYSNHNAKFIFSSEMKAIYPFLKNIGPSSDFKWIASNIISYESTDKCLIDGIKRFPAAHWGIFKSGELKLNRYWNILDNIPSAIGNYEQEVERYRELFIDACRIRMRSDVRIGTALSGGIDSSATICTMAHIGASSTTERMCSDWQHAVVATFPGTPLDESKYALDVINHLGISGEFVDIDVSKHLHKLEDYLYQFEELFITSPIPMVETYRAIKNNGISVTLDGHGADEILGGYPASLYMALFDAKVDVGKIRDIYDTYINTLISDSSQFNEKTSIYMYYLKSLARLLKRKITRHRRNNNINIIDHKNAAYNEFDIFTKHLYGLSFETTLPTLIRNYDRYSMANGVEIRMPFMDYRLVEFSFSLPWTSKLGGGYTKRVLRDAIGPYMPASIAQRKVKIGFNSPFVDWIKGPMREYFTDHMASRRFRECDLIDSGEVLKNFEIVLNNNDASFIQGINAWASITPYLWECSLDKRPLI